MLGIPLLRKSDFVAECDACGRQFEPAFGGSCARCGRLLCPEHLFSSWVGRVLATFGVPVTCPDCRSGQDDWRDGQG